MQLDATAGQGTGVSFRVRVRRDRTYLFGGARLAKQVDTHLYFILRVDEDGEDILLERHKKEAEFETLGTLAAGDSYALKLDDMIGLCASCPLETAVDCWIMSPGSSGIGA